MNDTVAGLVTAIESGRTDIVRSVISTLEKDDLYEEEDEIKLDEILNSLLTPDGTLLHFATKSGQADITRTLLSAGADPGIHNESEQTPLDIASTDKVKTVFNEQLLQAVAKSNIVNLRESGVIRKMLRRYETPEECDGTERRETQTQITLHETFGIFTSLGIGLVVATITLILEILIKRTHIGCIVKRSTYRYPLM